MAKGAVVLKIHRRRVYVLSDDGAYLTFPAKRLPTARYVGQHITLPLRKGYMGRACAVVAAALLLLVASVFFYQSPAHAWLTLDADSSLEVLIKGNEIIDVRALNEEGRAFLSWYGTVDKDLNDFVRTYLHWLEYSGDTKLMVTTTADSKDLSALFKHLSPDTDVTVVTVYPQTRLEAERIGISVGRAILLVGANQQGLTVDMDEIREDNPLDLLNERGLDLEQVKESCSDPDQQADSIKDLVDPAGGDPDGNSDLGPGDVGEGEGAEEDPLGEGGQSESGSDDEEEKRTGPPPHANGNGRGNDDEEDNPRPPSHANGNGRGNDKGEDSGPPAHANGNGRGNDKGEDSGPPAHANGNGRGNDKGEDSGPPAHANGNGRGNDKGEGSGPPAHASAHGQGKGNNS